MILLLLFTAHLISDFYLQSDEMAKNKKENMFRHALQHFVVTFIFLLAYCYFYPDTDNFGVIITLIVLVTSHVIIDQLKLYIGELIEKGKNISELAVFLADQILHGMVVLYLYSRVLHGDLGVFNGIFHAIVGTNKEAMELSIAGLILVVVIIYILATAFSGHVIRLLLGTIPVDHIMTEGNYSLEDTWKEANIKTVNPEKTIKHKLNYSYLVLNKTSVFNNGKLIGYLERLLVISLVAMGAYQGIGFIVAAKSFARFKQLDNREWAEYFISGTLLSIFLGVMIGLVFQRILAISTF